MRVARQAHTRRGGRRLRGRGDRIVVAGRRAHRDREPPGDGASEPGLVIRILAKERAGRAE